MQDDVAPTPTGLLNCLHSLAGEAAHLNLHETFFAIHDAIEACRKAQTKLDGFAVPQASTDWMH